MGIFKYISKPLRKVSSFMPPRQCTTCFCFSPSDDGNVHFSRKTRKTLTDDSRVNVLIFKHSLARRQPVGSNPGDSPNHYTTVAASCLHFCQSTVVSRSTRWDRICFSPYNGISSCIHCPSRRFQLFYWLLTDLPWLCLDCDTRLPKQTGLNPAGAVRLPRVRTRWVDEMFKLIHNILLQHII